MVQGRMSDEQARIRGYLQAQGAKLPVADIVDKVRAAMADLRQAADAVPPARFADRPAPEQWSANEVMAHVVQAGRYFGDAIVRVLEGLGAPPPRARDTDPPRRTTGEWYAMLEGDREALFARALAADPASRLDATIEHPFFGPLNWRETLLFMRLHDLDHAGQLGKIGAALGA
jgi:uncharacterized damage-inducible protein DinB